MRLGLFGGHRLGLVEDGLVYDVTDQVAFPDAPGGPLAAYVRSPSQALAATGAGIPVADVRWEAPLPRPGKIIGAPANYYDHTDEMRGSATIVEWGVFLKAPTSVIGPGDSVRLPYTDKRTDYEGELAVVIGKAGKDVARESAMDHVFGYTCLMDITVRSTEDRSTRKSFDTFTPLGPWIVTADEIGDPSVLELALRLNGEVRQKTSIAKMIYGIPELVAYASSVMTLEPGDVIATGTPAGVGPLSAGDEIVMEIDRIGSLAVTVTAGGAIRYEDRPGPATALQRR